METADTTSGASQLQVRPALESDLAAVEDMVNAFVKGHPAETRARARTALHSAYFGERPVAHLIVASVGDNIVGMGQWTLIYDMFWGMYGAHSEWFYVRPAFRGRGIAVAIVAEICAQAHRAGAEFLRGGADETEVAALYERVAKVWGSHTFYLSAEAFRAFGELAGLPPRTIVRRLPTPGLNNVPPRDHSP